MAQGIYEKKGTKNWWMRYRNAAGTWVDDSTGCTVEADARAVYDSTVTAISGGTEMPARGPMTVRQFAARWIKERRERELSAVEDDDARLRDHILPSLGDTLLSELRPKQVQAWLRALKKKPAQRRAGALAPRTVRHCFNLLRTMMTDAIAEERIDSNPCVLKRGDLPKKVDKDPTWRATAIFVRGEVEQLISDSRIDQDEQAWNALHFLTGIRPGEGSAIHIRDYDQRAKPLGRITVSKAWDRDRKKLKGTKTEVPRDIPVHPVLAMVLAQWLLSGWEAMMGRPPRPDDLLVPARPLRRRRGTSAEVAKCRPRGNSSSLKTFHATLELLGMKLQDRAQPFRRFYDSRRTFITLALADGATKDILRWVTHPVYEDQMDAYTSIPYAAKCEHVARLQVSLVRGELVEMPKAANSHEPQKSAATVPLQSQGRQNKNAANPEVCGVETWRGVRDSKLCREHPETAGEKSSSRDSDGLASSRSSVESNLAGSDCSGCSEKPRRRAGPGGRERPVVVALRPRGRR